MRPFFTLSIAIRADHHGGTRMIWSPSNVYLQFAYTCMMCQIFFPSWFLVLSFIQNTKGACIAFVAWLIITQAPRTPCHKELPKSVTLLGKKQQSPSIYAVTSSKRTLDHSFSKKCGYISQWRTVLILEDALELEAEFSWMPVSRWLTTFGSTCEHLSIFSSLLSWCQNPRETCDIPP